MSTFRVQGSRPLSGTITPQGAKNEALQVISASLLTTAPVTLHNVPDILDVQHLIALVQQLGVQVERLDHHTYQINAANLSPKAKDMATYSAHATKIRGSVMTLGPLLARSGQAHLPKPGGDRIGRRRLDTHLTGMQKLGATFTYDAEQATYTASAPTLTGTHLLLDEASVTGTANLIMAASLAQGTTTIYNAACEPHIQQLCKMLTQMGAHIEGIGSNLLTIHGVQELTGTTHTLMPDMIEIGSFIGLAAMTQANITIKGAHTAQLSPILERFHKIGIQTEIVQDDLTIQPQAHYTIEKDINGALLTLSDGIWPSFPSDLLSILLVTAIQAKGTVLIHQKMYESRLFFVDKLIEMGAQIVLCDPHRATIIGLNRAYPLRGIRMTSPDVRAGISLLIAALSAQGTSLIENVSQIDRGYEKIDERLNALGASIERIA